MSVRRLDAVQPDSFSFTPENQAWAEATIGKYPDGKSAAAVIPVLWRAQEQNGGWISRPAMEHVAKLLDMSYIRVYEIATFYTMFQLSPVGRKAHVQVCGTTPCMLRGSETIIDVCRRRIGPEPFHVSADGDFSWEEVECLGACVNAPMVLIGKDTYEDLTPESFEKVLSDIAAGRVPKPGPQNGRQLSAPEGPLTTLTDPWLYEARPRAEAKPSMPPPTPAPVKPELPSKAAAPAAPPPVAPTPPEPVKAAEAQAVTKAPPAPASTEPAKFAAGEDKRNVRGAKKAGSPAPAAETVAKTAARSQQAAKATSPANRGTPRKRPRKDEP